MIASRLVIHQGLVKVRLTSLRKATYINTGVKLSPENWDGCTSSVTGRKDAARLTVYLTQFLDSIQEEILKLSREERLFPLLRIRDIVEARVNGREAKVAQKGNLMPFWTKFEASRIGKGTKATYAQTRKILEQYEDMTPMSFEDITVDWLRKFEQHLRDKGQSTNTRSIHLRNIRAVFNAAIDEDVTVSYPFRKFKFRTEQTRKRSLSVEDLRRIVAFQADPDQQRYKDYFLLIFYLIGINMTDLVHLDGIHDGRIEYRRAKTGRLYSIKVEPEALQIIERYRGEKYLLNVLDRWHDDGHGFLMKLNAELKRLGPYELGGRNHMKKICSPIAPEISTYWARHTWATIAASLDIPKETIAAALGHGGNTVTDIYIDFDRKKIDEANRKVIDYVLSAPDDIPE